MATAIMSPAHFLLNGACSAYHTLLEGILVPSNTTFENSPQSLIFFEGGDSFGNCQYQPHMTLGPHYHLSETRISAIFHAASRSNVLVMELSDHEAISGNLFVNGVIDIGKYRLFKLALQAYFEAIESACVNFENLREVVICTPLKVFCDEVFPNLNNWETHDSIKSIKLKYFLCLDALINSRVIGRVFDPLSCVELQEKMLGRVYSRRPRDNTSRLYQHLYNMGSLERSTQYIAAWKHPHSIFR